MAQARRIALVLLWTASSVYSRHCVCPSGGDSCATTVPPVCAAPEPAMPTPLPPPPPPPRQTPARTKPAQRHREMVRLNCTHHAYIIQDNMFYKMDLETAETETLSSTMKGRITGLAYNTEDNYLYGVRDKTLLRIAANGATRKVATVPFQPNMGTIDNRGMYWASSDTDEWATIDVVPSSKYYSKVLSHDAIRDPKALLERAGLNWDLPVGWAWTPEDESHVYGVGFDRTHKKTALFRWKTPSNKWELVVRVTFPWEGHSFSTVMATEDGIVYALENETGDIVRFDLRHHADMTVLPRRGPVSRRVPKNIAGTRCSAEPDALKGKLI